MSLLYKYDMKKICIEYPKKFLQSVHFFYRSFYKYALTWIPSTVQSLGVQAATDVVRSAEGQVCGGSGLQRVRSAELRVVRKKKSKERVRLPHPKSSSLRVGNSRM